MLGEVLPSIRRYGVYTPPKESAHKITLQPYTSRVVWVMHVGQRLPKCYWCVFIEGAEMMIGAEHIFGPSELEMKQYDRLDVSMERHWSTFRQDKPWMGRRLSYEYTFPDGDPRGTVKPWAYPMCELEHFKVWLHGDYWNHHFPDYVKRKYGVKEYQRALPIMAQLGVPLIGKLK